MRRNLISVSKLSDEGYTIICSSGELKISEGKSTVVSDRENDLLMLRAIENDSGPQSGECLNVNLGPKASVILMLAHKSLMHLGKQKVIDTLARAGIRYNYDMDTCEACMKGKQYRATYRTKPKRALPTEKGYCHADLCSRTEASLDSNTSLGSTAIINTTSRISYLTGAENSETKKSKQCSTKLVHLNHCPVLIPPNKTVSLKGQIGPHIG